MRRARLDLTYVGSNYSGWQRQPGKITIQSVLEECLRRLTSPPVTLVGSGRTDSGVHALKHPAHVDLDSRLTAPELSRALNALLPDDIAVRAARYVRPDWHARFDAKSKTYRYLIDNAPSKNPFLINRAWHRAEKFDIDRAKEAARGFIGRFDFSSFRASGCASTNPTLEIKNISIRRRGENLIALDVTGERFLRHMVRNIVGAIHEAARGAIEPDSIGRIIAERDRTEAGPCAPAHGLYLIDVEYDDDRSDPRYNAGFEHLMDSLNERILDR